MARNDQVAPRRSRRGAEQEKENLIKLQPEEEEDLDGVEEEVTRCICGHAEYPGPSTSVREQHPNNSKLFQHMSGVIASNLAA